LAHARSDAPPARANTTVPLQFPHAGGLDSRAPLQPTLRTATTTNILPPIASSLAWIEQKIVTADGVAGDLYGFRTLIVGDDAFVSAPAPLAHSGAVYVYKHEGDTWVQTQKIVATQADGTPPNWSDFFGWSLAVSGDTLLVGAPEAFNPMFGPAGGAYVFTRSPGGEWTQTQLLVSPVTVTLSWFGRAVAFSGDVAIIGESSYSMTTEGSRGAAHVFTATGGVWSETQLIQGSDSANFDDRGFGASLAANGTRVVVGAPGPDWSSGTYPQGAVYVFSNSGGTLAETQKLSASDGAPGDQFGYAVGLAGTAVLVGAPAANVDANNHQGAAYVFDNDGSTFNQTARIVDPNGTAYDQFGQAVAIHDGSALVGMWSFNDEPGGTPPAPTPGRVGLLIATSGNWSYGQAIAASEGTDGNSFGWDVALAGPTMLIGADADGSVHQYQGSAYFYSADTVFADGFDGM
jgi:hypothetical protein